MYKGIGISALLIGLTIVILRVIGILELNIVKVKYPDIMTVMYDRDWHGSAYNIREVSSYRWFEDGMVSLYPDKQKDFQSIIEKFPSLRLDVTMFDLERMIANDSIIEVCIEQVSQEIIKTKDGLFTDTYTVNIDANLQIFNGFLEPAVFDYAIKFTSPVIMTGLKSDYYVSHSIEEFCLYRMLHLLQDYFKPMQAPN